MSTRTAPESYMDKLPPEERAELMALISEPSDSLPDVPDEPTGLRSRDVRRTAVSGANKTYEAEDEENKDKSKSETPLAQTPSRATEEPSKEQQEPKTDLTLQEKYNKLEYRPK